MAVKQGFIYILTNKTRSVLYTGVISDLLYRIYRHRLGLASKFTRKYNAYYPISYEGFRSIQKAIGREKQLKNWKRDWKLELIRKYNSALRDLWHDIVNRARFSK